MIKSTSKLSRKKVDDKIINKIIQKHFPELKDMFPDGKCH